MPESAVVESTPAPSAPSTAREAIDSVLSKHSDSSSPATSGRSDASDSRSSATGTVASAVASRPDATPSPASSTDPATRQPSDAEDPIKDDDWLTPEKRQRILRNARAREAESVRTTLEQQLGFEIKDERALAEVRAFISNPSAYVNANAERLGITLPVAPAPREAAPPVQARGERPLPDARSDDGTLFYTEKQTLALLDWYASQSEDKLASRLAPLEKLHERMTADQIRAEANEHAKGEVSKAEKWEGFNELKPRILALMRQDGRRTLLSAYNEVFQTEYLPASKSKMRQSILDELKSRPVAPAGVSPSAQARTPASKRQGANTAKEAIEIALAKHAEG